MPITVLPILQDNYCAIIHNTSSAIVVDPGSATEIISFLNETGLSLKAILLTHHHWDHVDGVEELIKNCNIPVYAPHDRRIKYVSQHVSEGSTISIENISFEVRKTPGHTTSHVVYYCEQEQALFTGDTLFSCGCGRLFEGTAKEMYSSFEKILSYPDETELYFAHEYTLDNIIFALSVEPNNKYLQEYKSRLLKKIFSIPSTIAWEKKCNPFCRTDSDEIRTNLAMKSADEWEVFKKLRSLKNKF